MKDPAQSRDTFVLAGWLFADLMLALSLLFFASNTFGSSTPPKPTPQIQAVTTRGVTPIATQAPNPTPTQTLPPVPTPTPMPTPTPTPEPTQCETTVVLEKYEVSVGEPTPDRLRDAFQQFNGRVAGLVLAYGHAPQENFAAGETLARQANDELRVARPDMFRDTTLMEAYHDIDPSGARQVDFNVYFLSNPCN